MTLTHVRWPPSGPMNRGSRAIRSRPWAPKWSRNLFPAIIPEVAVVEFRPVAITCGTVTARVENGVVKKLDPNPKSLKSRGMLCARGNAGVQQLYDPDRIKVPMKRTNPKKGKGEDPKFVPISWDEALDTIADKMIRRYPSVKRLRPTKHDWNEILQSKYHAR